MPFPLLEVLASLLKKKHPVAGTLLGAAGGGEGASAPVDTTNAQTLLPTGETATTQGISKLEPSNLLAESARALEAITGETERLAANPPKPPPAPLLFALSMSKAAPLAGLIQQDYERKRSGNLPILMDRYQAITSALSQSNQVRDLALREQEAGQHTAALGREEETRSGIAALMPTVTSDFSSGGFDPTELSQLYPKLIAELAKSNPELATKYLTEAPATIAGAKVAQAQASKAEKQTAFELDFAPQAQGIFRAAIDEGRPVPVEHFLTLQGLYQGKHGLASEAAQTAETYDRIINEKQGRHLEQLRLDMEKKGLDASQQQHALSLLNLSFVAADKYNLDPIKIQSSLTSAIKNGGTFTEESAKMFTDAIGKLNSEQDKILAEKDLGRQMNMLDTLKKFIVTKEAGGLGDALDSTLKGEANLTFQNTAKFVLTKIRNATGLSDEMMKKADELEKALEEEDKKRARGTHGAYYLPSAVGPGR